MEFRDAVAAVRASWWLPVIGLVVGGAVALTIVLVRTPLFTSTTQLFVSTRDSASSSEVYEGSQFSQQRVSSYAELLSGEELAGRVIDRLDLDMSPTELAENITATVVTETVLIDVSVTVPSAEAAQQIAAAVGDEFSAFVAELETPEGGDVSPVTVRVTQRPEVPDVPSSPQMPRDIALGLLLGALMGAGLSMLRARLDRSVKDPQEASELAGAPVIGTVLRDVALDAQHTIDRADVRTAESYRRLRNNLQFLRVDEPPKVIMVSSAVSSEGKTTAVVNLGLALADADRRVTIVEADLRKPKVTRYLGMVGGVGLTNVLSGSADVEDVLQKHGTGALYVIAAGPTPPNPGELLSSSHMFSLLDKLRGNNDFVLVDAPPLLPVADSTGLSVYMDGVLLSVRYGSTRKEQLRQAAATLERVGARTLGVIMNIVPPKAEQASAYGYNYSYETDRQQSA